MLHMSVILSQNKLQVQMKLLIMGISFLKILNQNLSLTQDVVWTSIQS